nr:DJ-1/PfpI family protein [Streptococcus anginosus]
MKIAVLLYPACSLQEITTLTSILCLSFGQSLDYLASEKKVYTSEEGLQVIPDFTFKEVQNEKYDCIILPGTQELFVSLYDSRLISFLKNVDIKRTIVAAISSSPMFLGKAGLLRNRYYTGGLYYGVGRLFFFFGNRNFPPSACCKRQECYYSHWICLCRIFSDRFECFRIRSAERFLFEKKFLHSRRVNVSFRDC